MSSVSSVSSGGGLFAFLQSLSATGTSQATTSAASANTSASVTASGSTASTAVQGAGHHHHGHGHGDKGQLFQQIQQAVTSALQSAQQGSSTDPNQTIESAIAKVLNLNTTAPTQPAATPATASSTTPATPTTGTGNISPSAQFFQTLQNFGVDPEQFQQDFANAFSAAQNGTVDPSTAFQSFPPGSIIDTTG